MKLTVLVSDGALYTIADLPSEDCLDLVDEFENGDSAVLTFQMDEAVVKLARRHIVAIELG